MVKQEANKNLGSNNGGFGASLVVSEKSYGLVTFI